VNLRQLQRGLRVVTFGQFQSKEFPGSQVAPSSRKEWEEFASAHAAVVPADCDMSKTVLNDRVIYIHDKTGPGEESARLFTCGNWPQMGQPRFTSADQPWKTPAAGHMLLRNHFVWHPEVFQLASRVVSSLGLFQYMAVHARYNDFQFKEGREAPEAIVDRWMDHFDRWLGEGDTIYISTDSKQPEEFVKAVHRRAKRPMKVVVAADVFDNAASPIAELWQDMSETRQRQLKGAIEQVICTFGKVFVGTEESTFSGYIERMRTYTDAPQHVEDGAEQGSQLIHTSEPSGELIGHVENQLAQWKAVEIASSGMGILRHPPTRSWLSWLTGSIKS